MEIVILSYFSLWEKDKIKFMNNLIHILYFLPRPLYPLQQLLLFSRCDVTPGTGRQVT
jgi:hypothetical protein